MCDFSLAGNQKGGIDNPVPLGPDKLLPVDDQQFIGWFVDQFKVRNTPTLTGLGDFRRSLAQSLLKDQVIRSLYIRCQQRNKGHVEMGLFASQLYIFQKALNLFQASSTRIKNMIA